MSLLQQLLVFFILFPAIDKSFWPIIFRMSILHILKCVRTSSQPANRAWPHRVTRRGPRHLWHGRKDRVCVFLPLYLTAIFHCSMTFTSSLPIADKCPTPPETFCLHSSVPRTSPQPWPNLIITILNHLSVSKQRFLPLQTAVSPFPQTCIHDLKSQPLLTPVTPTSCPDTEPYSSPCQAWPPDSDKLSTSAWLKRTT